MTRTTDEWKQLLDGATPGPWKVVHYPETGHEVDIPGQCEDCGDYDGIISLALDKPIGDGCIVAWVDAPSDQDRANFAAQAAVPEALAELIRLRTTIEEVRDHARDVSGQHHLAEWLTNILDPEAGQ